MSFKLSLPTDIPWRRICVSEDMLDPIGCDDDRPPRWRSSMAVYRFDPLEEYQPYDNEVISYIKVVVSITPWQPEIDVKEFDNFISVLPLDPGLTFPTYGAILQVGVSPEERHMGDFTRDQYPYFIDCEPKKRELYEAVTETGEVLSASSSALSVGKAATDTHSTESHDLDTGGFNIGWGALSIGTGKGDEKMINKTGSEVSNVRSTEYSTERRELQSHTTQLTQMYSLFQAYHLGTNRAMFFIEPRPHITQVERTFINGPRALEGVQEVFMVVVRPKEMKDYCVNALLETAHLSKQPRYDEGEEQFFEKFEVMERGVDDHEYIFDVKPGYVIDTSKGQGGYDYTILQSIDVMSGPTFHVTPSQFKIMVKVGSHSRKVGDETVPFPGVFEIEFTVYLKLKEPEIIGYARFLFMSARELCCCPEPGPEYVAVDPGWITSVIDVSRNQWALRQGTMSPHRFLESRKIAATIRDEMINSFASHNRYERGKLRYADSDVFHAYIADLVRLHDKTHRLDVPVARASGISDETRGRLSRILGDVTIHEVLTKDSNALVRKLDMDEFAVLQLKRKLLQEVTRDDQDRRRGPR